jgi:hypothetical protein
MDILLRRIPPEQQAHAREFLLAELERLHVAAGCMVPLWVNAYRALGRLDYHPEIAPVLTPLTRRQAIAGAVGFYAALALVVSIWWASCG